MIYDIIYSFLVLIEKQVFFNSFRGLLYPLKNLNFNKNKTESYMENSIHFQRNKPGASAHTKLQIVEACMRKKGIFSRYPKAIFESLQCIWQVYILKRFFKKIPATLLSLTVMSISHRIRYHFQHFLLICHPKQNESEIMALSTSRG